MLDNSIYNIKIQPVRISGKFKKEGNRNVSGKEINNKFDKNCKKRNKNVMKC